MNLLGANPNSPRKQSSNMWSQLSQNLPVGITENTGLHTLSCLPGLNKFDYLRTMNHKIKATGHSASKSLCQKSAYPRYLLLKSFIGQDCPLCILVHSKSQERLYQVCIFQAKMELVNSIQLLYNVQEKGRNVLRRHGFHFFFIPFSSVYTGYQNKWDHYGISIQVCNSALNLYTWLLLLLLFLSNSLLSVFKQSLFFLL